MADAGRLGQLLSNLLKNALVHGAAAPPVLVSVRQADGQLDVKVSNQGEPIAPELAAQLFKPFFRGNPGSREKGLGLGLFIVAEIAKSHGGEIAVVSDDAATTFSFTMRGLALN